MDKKWLLYALGGGFGHLHRAVGLARAAARLGVSAHIVSNSPLAHWLERPGWRPGIDLAPQITISRLPQHLTPVDAARALEPLLDDDWNALIVDTFPRGLGGELADLLPLAKMKKVLVHRDLCDEYVRRHQLQAFIERHYELVLAPGERGPLAELAVWTPPWLVLEADEMLPPRAARRRLACDSARPVVAVAASGRGDEPQQMADQAARLSRHLGPHAQVRLVRLGEGGDSIRAWPLLKLLNGVDALVAAGGYNTVHEARAADVPLLAFPQRRQYDRQRRRLRPGEVATPDSLSAAVGELLSRSRSPRRAKFVNGTAHAVAAILAAPE